LIDKPDERATWLLRSPPGRCDLRRLEHGAGGAAVPAVDAALGWGGTGNRAPGTTATGCGWLGGRYGLFLLVGFFGAHLVVDTKALHNPLFDVLAVILTPVGALVAVAVGARLRPRRQQGTE
jgi:hypothetical protein